MRWIAAASLVLTGCGDLVGFGGDVAPLASIRIEVTGMTSATELRAALVWGSLAVPEPICLLPPESPEVAAVVEAGCTDPFRFIAARAASSIAVTPGVPATMELFTLPGADVMVGSVDARIAYGSIVLFDDQNRTGTLELQDARFQDPEDYFGRPPSTEPRDVVLGASFVSMTEPDQRVAFREGAFDPHAAFYPRAGCPAPEPHFSVVGAGGFTAEAAIAASLRGELPLEDPATCTAAPLADAVVTVPLVDPAQVSEVACVPNRSGTRYHEPPVSFDLTGLTWACASVPHGSDFDPTDPGQTQQQLMIVVPDTVPCRGIFHVVLRGCDADPACTDPEWSWLATPPPWWPCAPS